MASFTKLVCFFFFLLFTLQIHARDSHYFSKVTRNNNNNRDFSTNPNLNSYNDNIQDNQATQQQENQQQEEEEPSFVPQTTQVGYGLYGHETGLDAPTTTETTPATTTTTTTTNPSKLYAMDNDINNFNKNNNQNNFINNNNNNQNNFNKNNNQNNFNNNYNNNNFDDSNYENYESSQEDEPEFEELLSENSYTNDNINNNNVAPRRYNNGGNFYNNNNNKNKYYSNNNDNKKVSHGEYYGGVGYMGGAEKQGMSDTRYLENGKYFYDINAEKLTKPIYDNNKNDILYNKNFNNDDNNNNYYSNSNNNNNYNSNSNSNSNSNGVYPGYQSKFPKEEEFDFDDQP